MALGGPGRYTSIGVRPIDERGDRGEADRQHELAGEMPSSCFRGREEARARPVEGEQIGVRSDKECTLIYYIYFPF